MSMDSKWFLEQFSKGYSFGKLDEAIDKLTDDFDRLMTIITEDNKNYMAEAITSSKDKIITSRFQGIIALVDPDKYIDGDDFEIEKDELFIESGKFIEGESGIAWTLQRVVDSMGGVFVEKEKILDVAKQTDYMSAVNTVSISMLNTGSTSFLNDTSTKTVNMFKVANSNIANDNSIINVDIFKDVFLTLPMYGVDVPLLKVIFDNTLINKLSMSNLQIPFIRSSMSDDDLLGKGSKLSDFTITQEATFASGWLADIDIVYALKDQTYSATINGNTYSYTSLDGDDAGMIAAELSLLIEADTLLTVGVTGGYWSASPEYLDFDSNPVTPFVWFIKTTDPVVLGEEYVVTFIEPTVAGDLSIELDGTNPNKVIITLAHDGIDILFPFMSELEDLVNNFVDTEITVQRTPYYLENDEDFPYTTDDILLEQFDSKITIESAVDSSLATSAFSGVETNVIALANNGNKQVGSFVVVRFQETDLFSATIDGVTIDIDPSSVDYSYDNNEKGLAIALSDGINANSSIATSYVLNQTVFIEGVNIGESFTVSTSGENGYTPPVDRDFVLKMDIQDMLFLDTVQIPQLFKETNVLNSRNSPLTKENWANLIRDGYMYNETSLFFPQATSQREIGQKSVTSIKKPIEILENIVRAEIDKIKNTHVQNLSYVSRSYPVLKKLNSTTRAKSDRWFFAEAELTTLCPTTTKDIALKTIPPEDFEIKLLEDANATFDTIRRERCSPENSFGSLDELLSKDIPSYNKSGLLAEIVLPDNIYDHENILANINDEVLQGFVRNGLLADSITIDEAKALMKLAIQIDDGYMEQRFISLSSVIVLSGEDLEEFYSLEDFSEYAFGINDTNEGPDERLTTGGNPGIGGIDLDGVITMSDLYFKHLQTRALPVTDKENSAFIDDSGDWSVKSICRGILLTNSDNSSESLSMIVSGNMFYIDDSNFAFPSFANIYNPIEKNMKQHIDTFAEDNLLDMLYMSGLFPNSIEHTVSHCLVGHSKKYQESIFKLPIEGIEFDNNGVIVGIGSSWTIIQSIYNSFTSITQEVLAVMLADTQEVVEGKTSKSWSSALDILFMKISLYLISIKDTLLSASDLWNGFDACVGKVFLNDEFATDVLDDELFACWLAATGIHQAFSFSSDIQTIAESKANTIAFVDFDNTVSASMLSGGIPVTPIITGSTNFSTGKLLYNIDIQRQA